jgi:demethylmenaquinone methyltransferase/2-methoxy-6-polyprenyl-1,4-benzoquinol methylase
MNVAKAAFFDEQVGATWAAAEYGEDESPKIRRLLTDAQIYTGLHILEPGCGTGRLTEVLAGAVGPSGRVEALEISPRMVEASRKRLAEHKHVRVHYVAFEDYQDSGQGFDRIVCHQVFPHFDHKPEAVTRLAGLLRSEGLLAIVHFITSAEINDVHRKAGTIVEHDLMPPFEEMDRLFRRVGLMIDRFADDALGYFLRARPLAGLARRS